MKGYHNSRYRSKDNGYRFDSYDDFSSALGDFGKEFVNWNGSHGVGGALYGDLDLDDYGSLMRWSEMPLLGSVFRNRAERMKYEEVKRYNTDRARNLGIDLEDNPYPIMSGLYGLGSNITLGAQSSSALTDFYTDMERLKNWIPKKR